MSPEPLKTGREPTFRAVGPERTRARSPRGPLLASALPFVAAAPAFAPGAFDRAFQSPPYGGSAVAAAMALTLVRWRPSLSLPALVMVRAERIFSRSHWPSDVVADVIVGLLVVKLTDTRDLGGAR